MTLLACLCTNAVVGCARCGQTGEAAWHEFASTTPRATPGQVMERAIEAGRADVVLGILEHGELDVNAPCDPDRADSVSPFATALRACRAQIAALIAARPSFALGASMPSHGRWDWARTCGAGVVREYLSLPGTSAGEADGNGETLLHQVVRSPDDDGKLAVILAQPGVAIDRADATGLTPLLAAAGAGRADAVAALLDRGADPGHRGPAGLTALLIAATEGHAAVVERLVTRGGVNAVDEFGSTALHAAAWAGHARVVAILLAAPGADVNLRDQRGLTPLARAAVAGHADVIRLLLARADVAVNRVDLDRRTPLWWAAAGRHAAATALLADDPRCNAAIADQPAHRSARAVITDAGLIDVIERLDRRPLGADVLDPGDPYVEHVIPPPPFTTKPSTPH